MRNKDLFDLAFSGESDREKESEGGMMESDSRFNEVFGRRNEESSKDSGLCFMAFSGQSYFMKRRLGSDMGGNM